MVICKYFLRGTCRFGENCKNEHSYNDNNGSVMRKKQDIDPNLILKSVSNDMDKAEHGHQWPFTCYGPFPAKPCFPGFEDKSFEEVRLEILEAEKNGAINQYKQQLMQLLNETKMKMRSLQNPTPEATNLLKDLFNSTSQETQNTNTNIFATASNSIFGSNTASQPSVFRNTQPNIFQNQPTSSSPNNFSFAQNKNIFGNIASAPTTSGSIFNQNQAISPTNIFGGGNSIFGNPQQNFAQGGNIFQQANQNFTNTGNIFSNQFAQVNNAGNIFTNSPFSQSNVIDQNNPFKQNTAVGDPFKQNTAVVDPFKQNTAVVDPFKQNTTLVDPFKQNPPVVDPFKQNIVVADPFKQNTAVADPFKQNTAVADPFKQNTVVADPFKQMTSDPFKQNTDNIFKQNIFQQNQIPSSPFSTPFAQNSILAQSQGSSSSENKSIFGSTQSTVIQNQDRRQDDPTIYSKLEDLSEKEVKCYEAAAFEFGNIPVNPPTLKMC